MENYLKLLVQFLDQKTSLKQIFKELFLKLIHRKLKSSQKICGIIMEEHCLNICSLKVLEMINLNQIFNIEGKEVLQKIRHEKTPVIFVSGHFGNFELMAMEIEKSGVNLSAIYRPLNNIFLNLLMERIRR